MGRVGGFGHWSGPHGFMLGYYGRALLGDACQYGNVGVVVVTNKGARESKKTKMKWFFNTCTTANQQDSAHRHPTPGKERFC